MARHRPALCHLALSQEVKFPLEMGMRQAPAGAPRREEPMAGELLKSGSLHPMLWPGGADRGQAVHCDMGGLGADHEVALFTRPFPAALSRSGNPTGGGRSKFSIQKCR